jgi:Flp pilus assembly protein TadG
MIKWGLKRREGQSLVELAMTLPLLLLMFVGLVEIGAALRNYLVVVNANREGVRFAARGRWFDTDSEVQDIFRRTIAAGGCLSQHCTSADYATVMRTLSTAEWPANTAIAITYIEVPDQIEDIYMESMEYEDPIVHDPWITGTLPSGVSPASLVSAAEVRAAQAQADNYAFNERYYLTEGVLDIPSEDNLVIVDTWFEHEQMLKLPIFTAFLPVKFTLHARSEMRVTLDSRVH